MKSKTHNLFLLLVIIVFTSACDRPECKNTNAIFDQFTLDKKEYKSELAKQMQSVGAENLTYWFDKYLKKDDKEFIVIHIQGEGICAKGEILVNDWNKIEGMRREHAGYRGAELEGLKIAMEEGSSGTNFIFKDIDKIID